MHSVLSYMGQYSKSYVWFRKEKTANNAMQTQEQFHIRCTSGKTEKSQNSNADLSIMR